jgi:copper(I)-binding protein
MSAMRALGIAAAVALALGGPVQAGPRPHGRPLAGISVRNAQVRASLGGSSNSAAYMVIVNDGPRDDQLLSVSCVCADSVEAHVSRMEHGMMTMAPAGPVAVPAHGRVAFAPGGLHVMLMGVRRPLIDGRGQVMTLRFAHAGAIRATFKVRERIVAESSGMDHGMPGM